MSKLNNISVDGTTYNINDFHIIENNTSATPFIITENEPGIYIIKGSQVDHPQTTLYFKYIDSADYNVQTASFYGFLCLTDTSVDETYQYKNIGYIFDPSAALTHPCYTQPAPYGASLTSSSAGKGNVMMTTNDAQTVTGKKTFNTLPESSVAPTTNNQLANKKYVDDSTDGLIPYYDSGYYMQPTSWTVVSELPEYQVSGRIYFVSPDYVEQYANTSVIPNGFNSGVTWNYISNLLVNTTDHTDVKQSWQATANNTTSKYTSTQIHAPKYNVHVGATPNFTNTNSEDMYMYGVLEQRNPQTTALMYSAYLDVDDHVVSGTTYYYDRDDYDHTSGGTPIPIYIPGSTSFHYTIGTNGGLACLTGETPIKTTNTKTKQLKNLEVGDTVIDAEGNKTKVIKTFKHIIPMTFNITLSNEDTLTASPGHKFSIHGNYRKACQVVKDHKLDRVDGSTFDVIATEVKQEDTEVYEILTESGTYTLGNGLICECEAI